MTYTEKLNQYITEGRLIRNAWTDLDDQGRETACLLAAMSPEVAAGEDASACPADIMPQWLAHLTPWMDDAGSDEAWPGMVRRYAAVAARWHVLSNETWQRLDHTARRIALEDCLLAADSAAPAVEGVLILLRRAEAGGEVAASEWTAAGAAAWAAWAAAAWDAAEAARAAAVADSEWDAAEAAARAAEAARAAARAAGDAAWTAAEDAAADRITAAILTAIEQSCDKAEKENDQ